MWPTSTRRRGPDDRRTRFHLPGESDMRFNWAHTTLADLDAVEARELVVDAWRMVVPQKVWRARDDAHPDGPAEVGGPSGLDVRPSREDRRRMTTIDLPIISSCSVDGCSYNHEHDCHAGAITVTDAAGAACGTYVHTDDKGGVDAHGHVGACHRSDCTHNDHLECTASGVEVGVGADRADCLTFTPA